MEKKKKAANYLFIKKKKKKKKLYEIQLGVVDIIQIDFLFHATETHIEDSGGWPPLRDGSYLIGTEPVNAQQQLELRERASCHLIHDV